MQYSMLNVALFLVVVTGWTAVWVYCRVAAHGRARRHAEWTAMAAGMCQLDAELDRAWAVEVRQRRRGRRRSRHVRSCGRSAGPGESQHTGRMSPRLPAKRGPKHAFLGNVCPASRLTSHPRFLLRLVHLVREVITHTA